MLDLFLKAKNSKKEGFTIIELVIVIAVIGILSAVLIPNFSGTVLKADDVAKAANLSTVNKIVRTALSDGDTSMLKGYAAAVQNFGHENVKMSVLNAVYDSESKTFTKTGKVDTSDGFRTDYYWPVGAADGQTALECFTALEFVEYVPGAQTAVTNMFVKSISDDTNKYNGVYFVSGSFALYDDLNLGDAALVLLDGASVELNGNSLGAKGLVLLDTTGGTQPVRFRLNGGTITTFLGYTVESVTDFWNDDGSMNYAKALTESPANQVSVYQDCQITTTLGGVYLDVANASYYLYGGILISGSQAMTLAGQSHFVVQDGAYLLTDNGDTQEAKEYSAVLLVLDDNTNLEVSEKSVVSIEFSDASKNMIINGHELGTATWNSVNPLTYEVCASAVQNTLILYAQAGADMTAVMAIAEKFSVSVNNTVSTLAGQGMVTASGAASAISSANAAMTTAVYGAVSSSASAVATTAVNASAGAAIASLAGVTTPAGVRTLASTISSGTSSTNSIANSVDYSWYNVKSDSNPTGYTVEGGVTVYHITTARQLYSLSWIVAKGIDDFNGSVVSLEGTNNVLDLSAYTTWQPIGNGSYGFRGYMTGDFDNDGTYCTVKNMKIDTNSLTTITSLIGQAWSGSNNHAKNEGVNYGMQTGDKYALGFIGVLENGGTLTKLNFSNCRVVFNYNWNCSAAIAVGAAVSTGEDYSYLHDGKVITGDPAGAYNFVTYGEEASASAQYNATGPKWDNGGNTTDINYRAYKGWITTISYIETDESCYVECSGRPGGIVGSSGGRYSAGTPNNNYMEVEPYKTQIKSLTDDNSIFCSFGTLNIDHCTNRANVKQNWQKTDYCDTAGIAAYFVNKGSSAGNYAWSITNCANYGTIDGGISGGITGDGRTGVNYGGKAAHGVANSNGNVNYGTIITSGVSSVKQGANAKHGEICSKDVDIK